MDKSRINNIERDSDLLHEAFAARMRADSMRLQPNRPGDFEQANGALFDKFEDPAFDDRMLAFIEEQERLTGTAPAREEQSRKWVLTGVKWRRIAALFVLVCGLGVSLAIVPMGSVSGIFEMFTNWTNGVMSLQFNLVEPNFSVDVSPVPGDFAHIYAPTKLPREFDTAETLMGERYLAFRFSNELDGEAYVMLLQSPHSASFKGMLSGEEDQFKRIKINGYDGASVERDDVNGIFWSNGEYFFLLTSSPDVNMSMLKSIAKSVERT